MKGRAYRECTCRGDDGKQLGQRCPELTASGKHGTWSYAVDVPSLEQGKRKTMRRRGFTTKGAAQKALEDVRQRYGSGIDVDDQETVAEYLETWLAFKRTKIKPKSWFNYAEYVRKDLIPALGAFPLERLTHRHVAALIADMESAGRGVPTIRRCIGVLSSALTDAVKQRRLQHNVARYAPLPPEDQAERVPWTADQAVRFLDEITGDRYAELYELLLGTGVRRGEALALRWADLDLPNRVWRIDRKRGNLVDVGGKLVFGPPKSKSSAAPIGLSPAVVDALTRQKARQDIERAEWGRDYQDDDLVFCRENGAPLRPEYVLDHFHRLTDRAGLPRVRLHDCRHLVASILIKRLGIGTAGQYLRHTNRAMTDRYGHLDPDVSLAAADALADEMTQARAKRARDATTMRPHGHDQTPSDVSTDGVSPGEEAAS